ncbi:MAG: ATP-binding protein, partial [Alphaproteobacteria bacterium]|nr:ATP-binding protein [Alphaproteobacteria bacterium]
AELAADLDTSAIGGRGLALVRRFSVSMAYRREAGRNRVEIGLG